ncbi:MAG TPA: RidA family protein [Bacillota bacterium]|nr:RidA family protein [Bacillota bacterium]
MAKVEERIKQLGFELPEAPKPAAAYVPAVREGMLVFTAGQIPFINGEVKYHGKVGKDLTVEEGYKAAQVCSLNCLSVIKQIIGDLDNIKQILKVNGYVNSVAEFSQQHLVLNGASELLQKVFDNGVGMHARTAVGVNVLPLEAAVEVEMIVSLKSEK